MKQFFKNRLFKKKNNAAALVLFALAAIFWSFKTIDLPDWTPSSSVFSVLKAFGEKPQSHYIPVLDQEKVQMGEDLIKKGRTIRNGKKTKFISKFYKCTDCHNIVKEDPDLRYSDPEARLDYAVKQDIPFLQGTTLYGTVNRESWYNGDYYKKYGDLVVPARKSLRGALQLCAEVCSQGRRLEQWEEDVILSYLWTIDLKLEDLKLSKTDLKTINTADRTKNDSIIKFIKSRYLSYSPATFLEPNPSKNTAITGDPDLGEHIYTSSCLSCHGPNGTGEYLKLGKDKLSYKFLKRKTQNGKPFSLYNITRKGTYPIPGHKPYMPHYTKERLSEKQLEDLRAFIYFASK
jgi:mono/diheme cytochrome c family protein